eukprot:CAMPEP_0195301576 /NCGR_PEP_ID=MMETSP0707-20130614/29519_1 /TAXON_ID=33640 /ORGANISM="Asterionellopsis glacialis, Strain CCMP134" /LENGTH=1023 /DNA_ID=CAMNT_0040364555 /DNA_START=240 /DNA_END=3311 /DNA_ORIENTATION=-
MTDSTATATAATTIPAPNAQVLSLVGALSNANNHDLHVQAIQARDQALSGSLETYSNLCLQLSFLLWGCDNPATMMTAMGQDQLDAWNAQDPSTATKLQQAEQHWIPFGQMAGLILKNALLRPPISSQAPQGAQAQAGGPMHVIQPVSDQLKQVLITCLGCRRKELRAVASSVIATTAVSTDSIQPQLHMEMWPTLMPSLLQNLAGGGEDNVVEGTLVCVQKIMEDGPQEIRQDHLDALIPVLIQFIVPPQPQETLKIAALKAMVNCLNEGIMPNSLVVHFNDYLGGLSGLANDPSPEVRKWVCRSIVTLLVLRTEYVEPHMEAICQFMLTATADTAHPDVALDACEFWLTFCTLDDESCTPEMIGFVGNLLPQLVPVLLRGMVYSADQREELMFRNEMDAAENPNEQVKPVFHKSKNKHQGDDDGDEDDDGEDDDFDDDEGNEWTLRKCSAASLDSFAGLYGPGPILPSLLPALQEGLSNADPWVQEASVLALGAIADGCMHAMAPHMAQLHQYLMGLLSTPESPQSLPQLKSIAAWTVGRYAQWAIGQVQSGTQGHLLAQMTEVFVARMGERNRRVQAACCSAFGVIVEQAGDLMVPYLEPICQNLVAAMPRYQGRSLLILFDTLGIMADFVGPAIGEGNLPGIYVPALLHMWNEMAKQDPTDRTLLPLMESLSSIALVCGVNYQPFALETFDTAMSMIESVTLILQSSEDGRIDDDQDADPIVCAVDLIDGLVEGLDESFSQLVASSTRYSQHFLSVFHAMTKHEVPGVRMSAFALLGDLARKSPAVLESALPDLLKEAVANLDPYHAQVCNNAVWAIGEICCRCGENPEPIKPFAADLMQALVALLVGNDDGSSGHGGMSIPGLTENSAAAMGRLAKVDASLVSNDLSRFLIGWCDGMAKITDPTERRDAYQGFVVALHANPQAIQQASPSLTGTVTSILFAIISWHIPNESALMADMLHNSNANGFQPFPPGETELQQALGKLMHDIKNGVPSEAWDQVSQQMPVNVRQLLREVYQLQ